jgi:hypothetical protein
VADLETGDNLAKFAGSLDAENLLADQTIAAPIIVVVQGRWHDVWMLRDIFEELDERIVAAETLKAKGRKPERGGDDSRQMKAVIRRMAEYGSHHCRPNMFGEEGRRDHGNVHVHLYAFKAGQIRLYGAFLDPAPQPRRFLVTAVDWAKKSNKPSKTVLERAIRLFAEHADAALSLDVEDRNRI